MINSNFHYVAKKIKTSRKNTNNERAARALWEKKRVEERERAKGGRMRSRYFPTVVGGTFHCGRQNFNTPNSRPAAAEAAAVRGASEQWTVFGPSQSAPSSSAKHKYTRHTQPLGVCSLYVTGALRCCHTQRRIFTFSTHTHSTQTESGKNKKRKMYKKRRKLWKLFVKTLALRAIRIVCVGENFPQLNKK